MFLILAGIQKWCATPLFLITMASDICFTMETVMENLALELQSLSISLSKNDIFRLFRQLVSFGIVGISSNILGYLLYLFLVEIFFGPKLAVAILYPIGVSIGYVANRRFTFQSTKGQHLAKGARYLAVYAFGYFLNLFLIIWLVETHGFPHQIVQAVAVLLVALNSFVLLRFFVFRHGKDSTEI